MKDIWGGREDAGADGTLLHMPFSKTWALPLVDPPFIIVLLFWEDMYDR